MAEARAAVVTAFNQPLELRQVTIPDLEPTGMLARVDAATLCGTDVHFWHGMLPAGSVPYVPGHETCGIIEEMNGPRTDVLNQPLSKGDRIIWAYPFCGHCYYCTIANQPTLCPYGHRFGRVRSDRPPYLLGGCAEYHYVPPASEVVRVPDEVPSDLAASAACALRTVIHGFELLGRVGSHETVLVQGCGPVGLYATAVARDRGAAQVLVIGAPSERLKVAQAWGADATLNLDEVKDPKDRLEWARSKTGGRGPDVVLQCASGSGAIAEGLDLLRNGGRFVSIGGDGGQITLTPGVFTKFIQIITVRAAEGRHFYQALQFLATKRNRFPFQQLITGRYRLDQVTDALKAMAEYREVKPVIAVR